jgi:glycerophosphoryl diester phosphodiesterase
MHDSSVERTTDGRGRVGDLRLAELKRLDAGFGFTTDGGNTFPFRGRGLKIPTLEEIFTALPEMTFNIEPKQRDPETVSVLCTLIRGRKMTERTIVGSFDQATIDDFRRQCPEVATAASLAEVSKFLALSKTGLVDSYSPPMQVLQVPQTFAGLHIITKEFVTNAHSRNLQVHVWTVNDESEMQSLIDSGVDGIMTDYPDRLLNLLGRKAAVE